MNSPLNRYWHALQPATDWSWLVVCAAMAIVCGTVAADDTAAASGANVPLPPNRPASPANVDAHSPAVPMRSAGEQLRSGDIPAALDQQQQAVLQLSQWLEQIRPAQSGSAQLAPATSGDESQPGNSAGPNGDGPAGDSTAGPRNGTSATLLPAERRAHLATSVWGHLPDREREAMQQSLEAAFLPEYADLVADYYEALAEQGLAADTPAAPAPEPLP